MSSDETTSGDEPLDPAAEAALLKQLAGLLKDDKGEKQGAPAPASKRPAPAAATPANSASSKAPKVPASAIDKDLIKELAALLTETGLTEIEVNSGGARVRVARAPAVQAAAAAAPVVPHVVADASRSDSATAPDLASLSGAVVSPMVGTAYVAPEPEAPPFVLEGDQVHEGQTLLIVEAMKTMNPIVAPRSGTVTRIDISDGEPVEFGQFLLRIE